MEKKKHVNIHHAREKHQREVMDQILSDGVCPFCRENLEKYHTKPIIKETSWWILTKNFAPYDGAKIHLLAICTKHIEHIDDLPSEATAELFELFKKFGRKERVRGGTILFRFGDMDITGATVSHLHAQLIVGCSRKDSSEKIQTKIGYKCPN